MRPGSPTRTTSTPSYPAGGTPTTGRTGRASWTSSGATTPTTSSTSVRASGRAERWPPSARPRSALLADHAYQLGLAHLRAAVDAQPRGLALQLGDRHRAGAGAGPLRGAALARRRLRSLAAERRAGPLRQLRDRLLLARSGLRLLHVAARGLALLLSSHVTSLLGQAPCTR